MLRRSLWACLPVASTAGVRIRFRLFVIAALLLTSCSPLSPLARTAPPPFPTASYWPQEEWRSAEPEALGLDSARLAAALRTMRERNTYIHSLLLLRDDQVLAEAAFYPYDGKSLHEVASVTKSIMTTLIGIAADQGKLSLDDPMLSFFPDRTVANRDARKEAITVGHLSSMSSGLDCTAEGDERTLQEMRATDDWVQFALDRPVRWEPGTQFVYCSPAIHLLSPILQKATGMTALDFAKEYLFGPLGITDVMWLTDPQGFNRGSEGIYLRPTDMARLGYLWQHGGMWEGEQIVPRAWLEQAVLPRLDAGDGDAYGYGFWVDPKSGDFDAIGRGGQRISIVPAQDFLLVTTGGGFDMDEIEPLLVDAIRDLQKPLTPNPAGVAELRAAEAAVALPPAAQSPAALPAIAAAVSGKTYVFEANPLGMESAALDFPPGTGADAGPAEGSMRIKLADRDPQTWPVGFDGVYRLSEGPYGLPQAARGWWEDEETFVFEYDNIGNNDHVFLRMTFAGDTVRVAALETAHETGSTFEGKLQ
jgi:CubicO group peptidase (beta-lactamase class C family)